MEVYHNGQWGTVCGNNWEKTDAEVVCRELGFPRAATAHGSAYFGRGTGPIWLDAVDCHGNEPNLNSCLSNHGGTHDCDHSEDAGVVCLGKYICILHNCMQGHHAYYYYTICNSMRLSVVYYD